MTLPTWCYEGQWILEPSLAYDGLDLDAMVEPSLCNRRIEVNIALPLSDFSIYFAAVYLTDLVNLSQATMLLRARALD